jgi:hypothetical protein
VGFPCGGKKLMLLWDITQFPATGMIWWMISIGFAREFTGLILRRVINNVGRNYLPSGSVGRLLGV